MQVEPGSCVDKVNQHDFYVSSWGSGSGETLSQKTTATVVCPALNLRRNQWRLESLGQRCGESQPNGGLITQPNGGLINTFHLAMPAPISHKLPSTKTTAATTRRCTPWREITLGVSGIQDCMWKLEFNPLRQTESTMDLHYIRKSSESTQHFRLATRGSSW